MLSLIKAIIAFFHREEGQTLTEYALIIVLVSIVVIAMLTVLGINIGAVFTAISNTLGAL